jgi:hypothetical protein
MVSAPVHVRALMGQHRDRFAPVRVKPRVDPDRISLFVSAVIHVSKHDFAGLLQTIQGVYDLLAVKSLAEGRLRECVDVVGQQNVGIGESVLIITHDVVLSLHRFEIRRLPPRWAGNHQDQHCLERKMGPNPAITDRLFSENRLPRGQHSDRIIGTAVALHLGGWTGRLKPEEVLSGACD